MAGIYTSRGKRILDILGGGGGLLMALPLLVVAVVLLRITAPGPIMFTQMRTGQGTNIFRLYKLRTMTVNPIRKTGQIHNDDPEILAVGRVLRRFKIDEIPQLWNVLKGDMSLVGPRPLVPNMIAITPDWAMARHIPRPGLTGPVQVRGGTTLSWTDRWTLDVAYRPGFRDDLWIMLKTLAVVALGEARFHAPAPPACDTKLCVPKLCTSKLYSTVTDFAKLRG